MTACKKDIEIDYRQVSPLYAVEASVSNEGMQARISQTNDMDDNTTTSDISGATVVITGSDGTSVTLPYVSKGIYKSRTTGIPGVTYTIDVQIDGHHFTSSSTMQKMPTINQFHFIWKHLYRNGKGFRWGVKRDDVDPNKELQQLFSFAREGSDDKDLLVEGDRMHLELRSIDQKTYDYFYSMQMMDNTGTNPIQNFTGGCLGYFSAYSQVTYDCVFHTDDVEEKE